MNTFITPLKQTLTPSRKKDSCSARRFKCLLAPRVTLPAIAIVIGFSVTPAQQPDPLTVTPQGNVGIGTPTPANKLSVAGNADVSGNVGIGGDIQIKNTSKITLVDENHGLRYRYFGNDDIDGPILYGWGGGALGFARPNKADQKIVLRWTDSGNVGIGTTSPQRRFQIGEVVTGIGFDPSDASPNAGYIRFGDNTGWKLHFGRARSGETNLTGLDGVIMTLKDVGNVGIGTTDPTKAKLEINGSMTGNLPGRSGYFGRYDQVVNTWNPTVQDGNVHLPVVFADNVQNASVSLYASNEIWGEGFRAFSDERIKRIAGRSVAARDLATLMSIEVTDYSFIDTISKGTGTYKKVTGQQLEKVFPQAVTRSTDVVPDIYQRAMIKDGWVMLATNLKKGDRVRLIGEKSEGIHEVLEVAEGRFRTAFAPDGGQVFVYGREVGDARSVDYDAISMLNVSATQQIKKEKDEEVKALQTENAALRSQLAEQEKRLAELEAKDKARDEKLAAIQSLLVSRDQPTTRNASLRKQSD